MCMHTRRSSRVYRKRQIHDRSHAYACAVHMHSVHVHAHGLCMCMMHAWQVLGEALHTAQRKQLAELTEPATEPPNALDEAVQARHVKSSSSPPPDSNSTPTPLPLPLPTPIPPPLHSHSHSRFHFHSHFQFQFHSHLRRLGATSGVSPSRQLRVATRCSRTYARSTATHEPGWPRMSPVLTGRAPPRRRQRGIWLSSGRSSPTGAGDDSLMSLMMSLMSLMMSRMSLIRDRPISGG